MNPVDIHSDLSLETLRRNLQYDPDTGHWIWLITQSNKVQAGDRAGTVTTSGYLRVRFGSIGYVSARLAWFYMTGKWPQEQIDHINKIRLDDRWINLREANFSQNQINKAIQTNNTSGYKGVSWDTASSKWEVRVNRVYLGRYDTIEEAILVRDEFVAKWQGEFATSQTGG